ncbi:type IV toxin-antitoxin system AbiEi family antitoxin domain-containing protein [Georgenia daeguensis]|uniref:type IV toxin-antitoxin system AbiEi family antitoxin domain-containing protein n=1 Tax=Georgenia daeguensis TaxID=908355 RepID=UPI003CD07FEA
MRWSPGEVTRVVPSQLMRLADHQCGLVSARQAEEHGVTAQVRRRLCHSGAWSRVCRGVFDVAPARPRSWPERRRRTALTGLLRHGCGGGRQRTRVAGSGRASADQHVRGGRLRRSEAQAVDTGRASTRHAELVHTVAECGVTER